MPTTLTHELTYDDTTVEAVAAMLRDAAFREEVCESQGATRHDVSIDGDDARASVRIDQWLPTEGVPGFAKKFVGASTNIVQTEEWSSAEEGAIEVTIPGKPGEMVGTATVAARGTGVVETVTLEISVRIPLVGGKIEGLVSSLLRSALKAENRVGRSYLSR